MVPAHACGAILAVQIDQCLGCAVQHLLLGACQRRQEPRGGAGSAQGELKTAHIDIRACLRARMHDSALQAALAVSSLSEEAQAHGRVLRHQSAGGLAEISADLLGMWKLCMLCAPAGVAVHIEETEKAVAESNESAAPQGTQADFKNELLFTSFGINYNSLPERYRKVRTPAIQSAEPPPLLCELALMPHAFHVGVPCVFTRAVLSGKGTMPRRARSSLGKRRPRHAWTALRRSARPLRCP